ncbi:MAG: tetratricopeptide repeat protein, partial [Kofleriaceae bacterium]
MLDSISNAARHAPPEVRTTRFASARKLLSSRGRPDIVVHLIDLELGTITGDTDRQADLLTEKATLLDAELLDVPGARATFAQVLAVRPNDATATEALDDLEVSANNWQKYADKFIKEARAATDRSLATGLYVSAAEAYVRFASDPSEAEPYLRQALEIDPRNTKAAFHLIRLLRRAGSWGDLVQLLEQRAEQAAANEEKIAALLMLADVARNQLGAEERAATAVKRVLSIDAAQPQALRAVTDALAATQDWPALVATYQAALRARRDQEDLGILLQIAMVLWKHLGDLDQAEDYFRRVRKLEPAHPVALDFYRAYYPARGEHQKLLALLRQVEKARPKTDGDDVRPINIEIAVLAEAQNNPEKAIEAWKQHLRQEPGSIDARLALARLYRRTEKWNALLDLMKEEIERIPESDIHGRVEKLHEVVEIYRDKLRLDVMVINTYNAILKIDPDNRRAGDELAAKYRALGRWNDLIAVLTRKSEVAELPDYERVALLREIADLWSERFGNFANAIKPLERILELMPAEPEALRKLKEIYTKRRQWRALIDVLGREASMLPTADKRAKQGEMARLAAERLGDVRLAIEIYNTILIEAGPSHPETLMSLAALYEREKRYVALAEILERQAAAMLADGPPANPREAIALLEKLGQIYSDRLGAPGLAAEQWQKILQLEPAHARALRTLRELYATAGDFVGLENLYARLGQEEELVDALLGIADRLDAKAQRLPLVERAAQLAQLRAGNEGTHGLERARQVWERVLAIEPNHLGAATALAPIYARQEKWARLITVHEIELAAATDLQARLAKIAQIRQLCEQKLSSRTLAFTWTMRAFDLDPHSDVIYTDLLRLASEPEHWREIVSMFDRHLARPDHLDAETRLKLFRELARIATRRLGDPERARGYHREVLALAPDDRAAEQALEEIATQLADWPELLASYRRRADREQDTTQRAALLIDIAALQEEKLVDLDGAAVTYQEALSVMPGQLRALRALAKIEEARGNSEALVGVLTAELEQLPEGQAKFDLLMRIGQLEEHSLERPARALAMFREALTIPGAQGRPRPQAVAAIVRYLSDTGPGAVVELSQRVAAARLVLPHIETARDLVVLALEVIRRSDDTTPIERTDLDRALMRIYHVDLGDPAAAWTAGLRVLAADPADAELRQTLGLLAGQLGRDGEWASQLQQALDAMRANQGPSAAIRAIATELAVVATRLGERAITEHAWLTVLGIEKDAADAFDALIAAYRAELRWTDLRALLERRAEVTLDDRVRRSVLLDLAALEDGVLGQPGLAVAAHRRVLDLDPTHLASYQALERLYVTGQQWQELEELLARQADHTKDQGEQIQLAFRRAELFAHRLDESSRAVDLLEDVLGRQRDHAAARSLLEQLMPRQDVTLRVARLLEPIYEQQRAWGHLIDALRAQRSLTTGVEAIELLSRIAGLEEGELAEPGRAFEAWGQVLDQDPAHERARNELVRLANQLGRWDEATFALETAVERTPPEDVTTRVALVAELAAYYDVALGDAPRAIGAYRRLLELDPSTPGTIRRANAALARLYEQSRAWPDLRTVMRKQAEWAEAPAERHALLARVAALEEEQLADPGSAIATWRDVLTDQPFDAGALNALERLYQGSERWRELIEVLQRKLERTSSEEAIQLLARIAEIYEARLVEPDEAIASHLDILDRDPNNARSLAELARLYRSSERHADLLDVLERQASANPGGRLPFDVEIARLLGGSLSRPVEALERWANVLYAEPHHAQAMAAVEASLGDPDLRVMAADILRPVYDGTGQHERLAQLQLRVADWTEDAGSKLRALHEVVRLREQVLADKAGAFEAQLLALGHAATEPELGRVVAETERLAGELGREAELIHVYQQVAPNVLDSEIQRRLYLDIADLSRAVRRDLDLARQYYQKVLDAQPDDRRALVALESIYRETNDHERLTEVLLRQAEHAAGEVDERVGALVEAAELYLQLQRPEDAISTWEQVLTVAPERRDAVAALETLYREQGRWPDV